MGLFDSILGKGKPDIGKLEKKGDIEGLLNAVKYPNYFLQNDAIYALGKIKYQDEEFERKVLDKLLLVMEQEKIIKGTFPPDESGFWYGSLCDCALTAISNNVDTLPDKAVEILIKDTKMSEPGNRKEAYRGLAFNYKKISDANKTRVFNTLQNGLKNETNCDVSSSISFSLSTWVYPELKQEDKINYYYPLLNGNDERARDEAASGLLEYCGIDGIYALNKALKSGDKNAYLSAAWGFAYDFKHHKKNMDNIQLKIALNETNLFFTNVVQKSELTSGINYFTWDLQWALNALEEIGDRSAIPALLELQKKVQEKYNKEGFRKEFIQTSTYGGTISSDSNIASVKRVVDSINKREPAT